VPLLISALAPRPTPRILSISVRRLSRTSSGSLSIASTNVVSAATASTRAVFAVGAARESISLAASVFSAFARPEDRRHKRRRNLLGSFIDKLLPNPVRDRHDKQLAGLRQQPAGENLDRHVATLTPWRSRRVEYQDHCPPRLSCSSRRRPAHQTPGLQRATSSARTWDQYREFGPVRRPNDQRRDHRRVHRPRP
jgi:hypothetical protein